MEMVKGARGRAGYSAHMGGNASKCFHWAGKWQFGKGCGRSIVAHAGHDEDGMPFTVLSETGYVEFDCGCRGYVSRIYTSPIEVRA